MYPFLIGYDLNTSSIAPGTCKLVNLITCNLITCVAGQLVYLYLTHWVLVTCICDYLDMSVITLSSYLLCIMDLSYNLYLYIITFIVYHIVCQHVLAHNHFHNS